MTVVRVKDMSNHEYHYLSNQSFNGGAPKLFFSCSDMKGMMVSAAYWKHRKDNPKHSDEMDFGSAAHSYIIGKDENEFIVLPPGLNMRKKDDKILANKIKITQAGYRLTEDGDAEWVPSALPVISTEDFETIRRMDIAVQGHSLCRDLFAAGEREMSYFDDAGSIPKKCRTDWETDSFFYGRVVVDLKTTRKLAIPSEFMSEADKYGYHYQPAHYLPIINNWRLQNGLNVVDRFIFVVAEKEPPHGVIAFQYDEEAIIQANEKLAKTTQYIKRNMAIGETPSYTQRLLTLKPKPWTLNNAVAAELAGFETF